MATTGVVMDDGLTDFLQDLANASSNFKNQKVHLYTNNRIPANTDVFANYTDNTQTGGTAQAVTGWSVTALSAHIGTITATTNTFTITASFQSIYGIYLTDTGNTKLYGACRDPNAPIVMSSTVNVYQVTVSFSMKDLNT